MQDGQSRADFVAAYQSAEAMNDNQPAQAVVYGGGTGAAAVEGQGQMGAGGWSCHHAPEACPMLRFPVTPKQGGLPPQSLFNVPVNITATRSPRTVVMVCCTDADKPSIEGRKELEADPTTSAPVNSGSQTTGSLY